MPVYRSQKLLESGVYEYAIKKVVKTNSERFVKDTACLNDNYGLNDEEPEITVKLESFKYIIALFVIAVIISFIMFLFEIRNHRINAAI